MRERKAKKGTARGGRPRKARKLPPDFIGYITPDGFVIDDTSYFRNRREEEAIREAWQKATAKAHARLEKLIEKVDTKLRSEERLMLPRDLSSALRQLEHETVEHIHGLELKRLANDKPKKKGRKDV